MAELKPCPFCGGHARVARESDADHMGNFYTVKCDKCCAETAPRFASYGCDDPQFYAEVRELWDRRATVGVVVPDGTTFCKDADGTRRVKDE
jgi:hypothetical protein